MDIQTFTFQNYLKANRIVHISFIIGLLFFGIISFIMQLNGFGSLGQEINAAFLYIVSVIALIGIVASILVFKQKHKLIDDLQLSYDEKQLIDSPGFELK